MEDLETLCERCHDLRTDFDETWGRAPVPTKFCIAISAIIQVALSDEVEFVRQNYGRMGMDIVPVLRERFRLRNVAKNGKPVTTAALPERGQGCPSPLSPGGAQSPAAGGPAPRTPADGAEERSRPEPDDTPQFPEDDPDEEED